MIGFCWNPDLQQLISKLRFSNDPASLDISIYSLSKIRNNPCLVLIWSNEVRYSNVDWGRDLDSRWSTIGIVVLLNNCAIVWRSCKQQTVAISTMKAKYMALMNAVKEIQWIRQLFDKLHYGITPCSSTILQKMDNHSALALAKNPVHYTWSKHIDIKHQYIRETIAQGIIWLKHVVINKQYDGCGFSHQASGACPTPEVSLSLWHEVGGALGRQSFSVRFRNLFIVGSGKCYSIFILKCV
jgi:hypothetical protein